jgi:hypothetical protein
MLFLRLLEEKGERVMVDPKDNEIIMDDGEKDAISEEQR